ncbi:MAG: hypothetical protein AB7P37_15320 [Ramlibacter sp.]
MALLAALAATGAQAQAQPGGGNAVTGALRGITSLFNRGGAGSPATLPTSTIGIRGLGAEDIANAQPNPAAVSQMEALGLDEAQARSFAAEAALTPVTVAPLPAPVRASGSAGGTETAP